MEKALDNPPLARREGAIAVFVKGGLIGIANIIPGVSGGTFALILGLFDRLIAALNALGPKTAVVGLGAIRRRFDAEARAAIAAEWRRTDFGFLLLVGLGSVAAIAASSFLIDWLLREQHAPTLAFFIGLILPSIAIPWAMMDRRGWRLLWIVPGAALTWGISQAMPGAAAGSESLWLAGLSGAIAVSAMILPGLSGSYVLLVLGQYQVVLDKITGFQRALAAGRLDLDALVWLGALGVGLVIGMLLFARLLSLLLERHRAATLAFLIGLLLGSLWVLWPYKDIDAGADVLDRGGEIKLEVKIATAPNRLPIGSELLPTGVAFAGGLLASGALVAAGRRRGDIDPDHP